MTAVQWCPSCKDQGYDGAGSGYDPAKQELCDFHDDKGKYAERKNFARWDDEGRLHAPKEPGHLVKAETDGGAVVHAPLDRIRPFADQPRTDGGFDEQSLQELAEGFLETGQTEAGKAIRVEDDPDVDYELVSGERRLRALQLAGIPTMKLIVVEVRDKDEQFLLSCVENAGRKDMSALDCARYPIRKSLILN